MSASYDLRDVAALLGIDGRTLRKRIDHLKLKPARDPQDARRHLLSQEQIEKLRQLAETADGATTGEQLQAKVKELELRVAALERRQGPVRGVTGVDALERASRRANVPAEPAQPVENVELPAGTVALGAFARAHQIAARTASEQANEGRYPVTTRSSGYRVGESKWYLTPEQQTSAVAWWSAHSTAFRPCQDCPHTT